jgi:SAM-dependent methyltransferase
MTEFKIKLKRVDKIKEGYEQIYTRQEFRDFKKDNFKNEEEVDAGLGFDSNQYRLLLAFKDFIKGSVLEVGSRQTGNTTSFREDFPNNKYVGLDMQEGNNVDVLCDLTKGIEPLGEGQFGLIISCSVLEHTPQPWLMAANMERLLEKNGVCFLSVPWIWRFHKYPDDYFRYTPAAIKSLFPNIDWTHTFFHTNLKDDIYDYDEPGVENKLALIAMVDDTRFRKFLPCTMLTMVGYKK